MLLHLLWQKALVRRNELVRGSWRRRIGWLVGVGMGALFIAFVFTASLAVFEFLNIYRPEAVTPLVSGGFAVLTTLALFWGLGTALSDLYLSTDLELLLAAPVPRRDIFLLKLLGEMWQVGIAALIPITSLVAYGVATGAGWSYYLAAAFVWVLVLATLVAASMVIVMLVMRLMPAQRAREIYSFIYVIMFAALWLGWMLLSRGGNSVRRFARLTPQLIDTGSRLAVPPASWAGNLMLGWHEGHWSQVAANGALLLLMAGVVIGLAYALFERSFHHDWAVMHEVATIRPRGATQTAIRRLAPGQAMARWLPWPGREVAAKDWTIFPRDLRQLSRLVMPMVVSLFYVYQFGFVAPIPRNVPGIGFWLALFILPIVPLFFALALGTPAIGKEGANFELFRVAPISSAELLAGKVWMAAVPTAALAILITLMVAFLLNVTPPEIVLLVFVAGLVSVAMAAIAVALGALAPNFKANDYRRAVGPLATWGTMLCGGLVWAVMIASLAVLSLHLPAGDILSGGLLRALGSDGAILAGLLRSPWLVVAVLLLDGLVVAGLALLWRFATHRIAAWQPTEA